MNLMVTHWHCREFVNSKELIILSTVQLGQPTSGFDVGNVSTWRLLLCSTAYTVHHSTADKRQHYINALDKISTSVLTVHILERQLLLFKIVNSYFSFINTVSFKLIYFFNNCSLFASDLRSSSKPRLGSEDETPPRVCIELFILSSHKSPFAPSPNKTKSKHSSMTNAGCLYNFQLFSDIARHSVFYVVISWPQGEGDVITLIFHYVTDEPTSKYLWTSVSSLTPVEK